MKRFGLKPSLRKKITLAFLTLALINGVFALTAYFDLQFIQQRVVDSVITSEFENTIHEMRRHEKNLFLYGDPTSLGEAMDQVMVALNTITGQRQALQQISEPGQIGELEAHLVSYRDALNTYELQPAQRPQLVTRIRDEGHTILNLVSKLDTAEQLSQSRAISRSQWVLGISMLLLVLSLFAVASIFLRSVLNPLQLMTQDMDAIARGQFNKLETHSDDHELVIFSSAFNHMLHELDNRRRRLQHSEKMASLGVLTAGVAHELNNPLSNISSTCQLMMEDAATASPEQLSEWARMIDAETGRAHNIVRALLNFGRHQKLQLQKVDVQALVQQTLILLKGNVRQYHASIDTHIPPGLNFNADFQKLQQVLINVLRNALDTQKQNIVIRISARLLPRKYDFDDNILVAGNVDNFSKLASPVIHLSIQDDGPGIPMDVYPHIFDPFYTTHEPGMGMGLGLAIVQEIVEEHEGIIAVISQPGAGTTVLIQLPTGNNAV
jgi:signal transduction histidine kinase